MTKWLFVIFCLLLTPLIFGTIFGSQKEVEIIDYVNHNRNRQECVCTDERSIFTIRQDGGEYITYERPKISSSCVSFTDKMYAAKTKMMLCGSFSISEKKACFASECKENYLY